ncbi:hypothetical protein BDV38DRAFT_244774 [Aspergillus pseudotamarii]|uniref:Uncharacterized protein n=1 Tax=Aspergillus pseudotamarii TaxID=132259 RepID=A0A5N6SXH5_ASPPS|nr:uncharacterized protein BDV38DRAFT_244774 [Aspergillus pseudotamarii]KAE8138499.1 hypothetical protein BDV38DRAFT_244774 [Aspergillus pseudotamarii]
MTCSIHQYCTGRGMYYIHLERELIYYRTIPGTYFMPFLLILFYHPCRVKFQMFPLVLANLRAPTL